MDCSPFYSIDEEQMCTKPNREMPALLYFQHIDLSLRSEIELNLIWNDTNVDCGTYNFNRNHYKSVHNPVNIDERQMSSKDLTNSATRYNFLQVYDDSRCQYLLDTADINWGVHTHHAISTMKARKADLTQTNAGRQFCRLLSNSTKTLYSWNLGAFCKFLFCGSWIWT